MYTWKSYYIVQSDYQHWANDVLFSALDHLHADVLATDQGLVHGSLHHTLDHMLMVGRTWLARLRGEYLEFDHKVIHHPDWRELKAALRRETRKLQAFLEAQPPEFFDRQVTFVGNEGRSRSMWVRDALTHLFIHFAHCRGQVAAVATRLGAPSPEMDFVDYRRGMERLLSETQAGQQPPAAD